MRMGTARLAHLGLAGSELHVGVRFDDHLRVAALVRASGDTALLYPGPGATPVDRLREAPRTLVVVDGTWHTARKIVARSRLLRSLPRVSVQPAAPSAYRIRREPAPDCLSTVEAIVAALVALEGDDGRFASLRAAFARLVETQLAYVQVAPAPYRHERKRRRARRPSAVEMLLATRFADVVLAQAEGNPHDAGAPHELVHLVALRPATGERLGIVVRPRRPLAPRTPARLGLDETVLAGGAAIEDARHAWAAFLAPGDVLVGWGTFTPAVLAAESAVCSPWIDLRSEVARRLRQRVGGTDAACEALGVPAPSPWAPGRGGYRLATLARLIDALRGEGEAIRP
jgi:DTW domain-containing protein YfiP